jgi:hypothetical protein
MKGVVTRIYVAPLAELGQAAPPRRDAPARPRQQLHRRLPAASLRAGARALPRLEPGAYLVRLESATVEKEHGHDHFAPST